MYTPTPKKKPLSVKLAENYDLFVTTQVKACYLRAKHYKMSSNYQRLIHREEASQPLLAQEYAALNG